MRETHLPNFSLYFRPRTCGARKEEGFDRDHSMYRASTIPLLHAMVAVDVVDGLGFREKDKQTVAEHGECGRGGADK